MRFAAVITGFVVATNPLLAQGTAAVAGTIRDEAGRPIREALVVIDPDSLSLRARTDDAGRFRIASVPAGRLEVRVVRIGYRPHSRFIDVTGAGLEIEIALQSVPIPLDTVAVRAARPGLYGIVVTRGIALLPHEPRALRGVEVQALNTPHTTRTGADGRFSLPQLPEGSHGVTVTLEGFATRVVPVTVPPDGGIEVTVTLDSLYAEYQRWDEDRIRGVAWRTRRASNPATFLTLHELDLDAGDLRDGLRYAPSLLSRGLRITRGCIYLNGVPRPDVHLQDIAPTDVASMEVYPPNTLQDQDRLPDFPRGGPCHPLWSNPAGPVSARGRVATGGAPTRTGVRQRGNIDTVIVIWTRRN